MPEKRLDIRCTSSSMPKGPNGSHPRDLQSASSPRWHRGLEFVGQGQGTFGKEAQQAVDQLLTLRPDPVMDKSDRVLGRTSIPKPRVAAARPSLAGAKDSQCGTKYNEHGNNRQALRI